MVDIYRLEGLAEEPLQQALWEACNQDRWRFGHGSNPTSNTVPFWYLDLNGCKAADDLWQYSRAQCEELIGQKLKVIRQYANGHTFGQGGQPHRDDDREGTFTLLYYPMPEWQIEWGGETRFFDKDMDLLAIVQPASNRGVFFDSRILHVGTGPSRICTGLRVTVAYKLQVT